MIKTILLDHESLFLFPGLVAAQRWRCLADRVRKDGWREGRPPGRPDRALEELPRPVPLPDRRWRLLRPRLHLRRFAKPIGFFLGSESGPRLIAKSLWTAALQVVRLGEWPCRGDRN